MRYIPSTGFSRGKMRYRIDVQEETSAVDDIGQPTSVWTTTLHNEPACWEPMAGSEYVRGRQVEAGISGFFIVNFRDNIYDEKMRIRFNGQTFGIVHIKPVDGGRKYLEIHYRSLPE